MHACLAFEDMEEMFGMTEFLPFYQTHNLLCYVIYEQRFHLLVSVA